MADFLHRMTCMNKAAAVINFRAEWFGSDGHRYNSGWTSTYPVDQSQSIDLNALAIPDGAEMWARVSAEAGEEKNSPKVHFTLNQNQLFQFEVSGTTTDLHIKLSSSTGA